VSGVACFAGLANLRRSSLVVLDISGCGADESGSASLLEAILHQAQSLSSLRISGNRLSIHGTSRLRGLLAAKPLALQSLELQECQAALDVLGSGLLEAASSLM
jgi:hypothetical protein